MTERDLRDLEEKRGKMDEALEGYMRDAVRITDRDGTPVREIASTSHGPAEEGNNDDDDDDDDGGVEEEIYAAMTKEDIDVIVECINTEKAKGNEAFMAGEYAQALLYYTLALERAAELPDDAIVNEVLSSSMSSLMSGGSSGTASKGVGQLFPRHVVLSNRSACFLKLGHHEKSLKDGADAEILDPMYVKGIFRKGLALHAMGQYEEAIGSLALALKIEPKNKQIQQALGFAEIRMTQEIRKRMQG